jgi:hypothetical protein
MATQIYIFGEGPLWNARGASKELDLHSAVYALLQGDGELTWDGDEHSGPCWNVDLLLYNDAEVETWVRRLVDFFRKWGVTDRALSFTIIREGAGPRWEHRRIEMSSQQAPKSHR